MTDKVKFFFELLRGQYGAAKLNSQWPTPEDLQLAIAQWRPNIEKHTEQELSGALAHARRMMATGDDEWMWPNIGLILSGARRINHPSHKEFPSLPNPVMTKEQRIEALRKLREESGL